MILQMLSIIIISRIQAERNNSCELVSIIGFTAMKKHLCILIAVLFFQYHFSDPLDAKEFISESDQYHEALRLLYSAEGNRTKKENYTSLKRAKKLLSDSLLKYEAWRPEGEGIAIRSFHLGIVSWYLGESEQALNYFEKSYKAFPFKGEAIYNRFLLLQELNRTKEAESEYKRFINAPK
jgi:tetratricopeptide (TPR) repeat protein